MRLITALFLGGALIAISSAASAQEVKHTSGVYGGIGGGLVVPDDTYLSMPNTDLRVTMDDGYNATATAGYDFGPIRVELEGMFSRASADQLQTSRSNRLRRGNRTADPIPASYSLDKSQFYRRERAVYVNALADIPLNDAHTVEFTGGIGIGYGDVRERAKTGPDCGEVFAVRRVHNGVAPRREDATGTNPTGKCTDQGEGAHGGLTGQLIAGLKLRMSPTSRWTLSPTARYVKHYGQEVAGKDNINGPTRFTDQQSIASWRSNVTLSYTF